MDLNPSVALIILFQLAMIAFNDVIPVLNLSVFNVRRTSFFAFKQSKRTTIGGGFISVNKGSAIFFVVEDFAQEPVGGFAVRAW